MNALPEFPNAQKQSVNAFSGLGFQGWRRSGAPLSWLDLQRSNMDDWFADGGGLPPWQKHPGPWRRERYGRRKSAGGEWSQRVCSAGLCSAFVWVFNRNCTHTYKHPAVNQVLRTVTDPRNSLTPRVVFILVTFCGGGLFYYSIE